MKYSAQLSFPAADNERRDVRRGLALHATVREMGAAALPAKVTDLSTLGCRIAGCVLPRGAEIWLRLPETLPLRAHIVWSGKGNAGCAFYAPLPTSLVIRMAGR